MTQLEYVVWEFIEENPECTPEDISSSFAKAPQEEQLFTALSALELEKIIRKVSSDDVPAYYTAKIQA